MKRLLLILAVTALYLLHQDFWNWRTAKPLMFGFLPAGMSYHAIYTIAVSLVMALIVRAAWPSHLEDEAERAESRGVE